MRLRLGVFKSVLDYGGLYMIFYMVDTAYHASLRFIYYCKLTNHFELYSQ